MLKNKKLILGVTGGIAAYRAVELLRHLQRGEAQVRVIMTRNATRFVTPLTFSSLTGFPTLVDSFSDPAHWEIDHIEIARWADLLLVAPATANIIGKAAGGICDDLLSTTICACDCPQLFAPAMNTRMYHNPAVQRNLELLRTQGVHLVDPVSGALACGDTGTGKLAEPVAIARAAGWLLSAGMSLKGSRLLINAGPTREPLDPVRYLSNRSSGRLGYALAEAAAVLGAEVTLVSGPTQLAPPIGCRLLQVTTAREMEQVVGGEFDNCDVFIAAAAVTDWMPLYSASKLKKGERVPDLKLEAAPDILARMGARKQQQLLIGFALETDDGESEARRKMESKQLDLICLNHPDQGLEGDEIRLNLMTPDGTSEELSGHKEAVAWSLLQKLASMLQARFAASQNTD
ncbi:MAG: bifunctional phosphopantothenoylcysteine decarboxylase/phosphopantothenate--cysteine ligase CoaBC [Candidatus Delongbacteria bacterium]|nr:bifunctional phosphopantothenoylcysteine decarboxylase/phosphopantothenate--cysteine ligase CoaBC [Candidatus Delongbacteria bacterium]